MKKRNITFAIIIIILAITLIPITVYAWISYTDSVALVTTQSGFIEVEVKTTQYGLAIEEVEIAANSLTYVDFTKDIAQDRSKSLDLIATSIKVEVKNTEGSFSVKNKINLAGLNTPGLIYILIYEGKNIDENHFYETNYFTYITNILDGETNEVAQRALITSANQSLITDMSDVVLEELETLTFQIVIWGDYNKLVTPATYLEKVFSFNIEIESIQSDGVFS